MGVVAAVMVVAAATCLVAYLTSQKGSRSRDPPLLSQPRKESDAVIPRILLLGPVAAGKSTLFRAALELSGEPVSGDATYAPTRGLVRRLLELPSAISAERVTVQLCDAGGGEDERRQWRELVQDDVGALVFVCDVSDGSKETRYLFSQLAAAPWARDARLVLAFTKADLVPGGRAALSSLSAAREAEFRAACPARSLHAHCLCVRDPLAAARVLQSAVG